MIVTDSLGRHWDSNKHPRDSKGRFIRVGHLVSLFDGTNSEPWGTGTVLSIGDENNINVRVEHVSPDRKDLAGHIGQEATFPSKNLLSVEEKAKISLAKNPDVPNVAEAAKDWREKHPEFAKFLDTREAQGVLNVSGVAHGGIPDKKRLLDGDLTVENNSSAAFAFGLAANYARNKGLFNDDEFRDILDSLGVDPTKTDDSPDGLTGLQALAERYNADYPNADGWKDVAPQAKGVIRQRVDDSGHEVGYGSSTNDWQRGGNRQRFTNRQTLILSKDDKGKYDAYNWFIGRKNKNGIENPKGKTVEEAAASVEPSFARDFFAKSPEADKPEDKARLDAPEAPEQAPETPAEVPEPDSAPEAKPDVPVAEPTPEPEPEPEPKPLSEKVKVDDEEVDLPQRPGMEKDRQKAVEALARITAAVEAASPGLGDRRRNAVLKAVYPDEIQNLEEIPGFKADPDDVRAVRGYVWRKVGEEHIPRPNQPWMVHKPPAWGFKRNSVMRDLFRENEKADLPQVPAEGTDEDRQEKLAQRISGNDDRRRELDSAAEALNRIAQAVDKDRNGARFQRDNAVLMAIYADQMAGAKEVDGLAPDDIKAVRDWIWKDAGGGPEVDAEDGKPHQWGLRRNKSFARLLRHASADEADRVPQLADKDVAEGADDKGDWVKAKSGKDGSPWFKDLDDKYALVGSREAGDDGAEASVWQVVDKDSGQVVAEARTAGTFDDKEDLRVNLNEQIAAWELGRVNNPAKVDAPVSGRAGDFLRDQRDRAEALKRLRSKFPSRMNEFPDEVPWKERRSLRNAGFALEDALQAKDEESFNRYLDRARTRIDTAGSGGNHPDLLAELDAIRGSDSSSPSESAPDESIQYNPEQAFRDIGDVYGKGVNPLDLHTPDEWLEIANKNSGVNPYVADEALNILLAIRRYDAVNGDRDADEGVIGRINKELQAFDAMEDQELLDNVQNVFQALSVIEDEENIPLGQRLSMYNAATKAWQRAAIGRDELVREEVRALDLKPIPKRNEIVPGAKPAFDVEDVDGNVVGHIDDLGDDRFVAADVDGKILDPWAADTPEEAVARLSDALDDRENNGGEQESGGPDDEGRADGGGPAERVGDSPVGGREPGDPDQSAPADAGDDARRAADAAIGARAANNLIDELMPWERELLGFPPVDGDPIDDKLQVEVLKERLKTEGAAGADAAGLADLKRRLGDADVADKPAAAFGWPTIQRMANHFRVGEMDQTKWEKQRNALKNFGSVVRNNAGLRTGNPTNSERSWRSRMNVMIRQHELADDTTFYRGMVLDSNTLAQMVPGAVITDRGVISASTTPEHALKAAQFRKEALPGNIPAVIEIRAHAGEKIAEITPVEYAFQTDRQLHIVSHKIGDDGVVRMVAYMGGVPTKDNHNLPDEPKEVSKLPGGKWSADAPENPFDPNIGKVAGEPERTFQPAEVVDAGAPEPDLSDPVIPNEVSPDKAFAPGFNPAGRTETKRGAKVLQDFREQVSKGDLGEITETVWSLVEHPTWIDGGGRRGGVGRDKILIEGKERGEPVQWYVIENINGDGTNGFVKLNLNADATNLPDNPWGDRDVEVTHEEVAEALDSGIVSMEFLNGGAISDVYKVQFANGAVGVIKHKADKDIALNKAVEGTADAVGLPYLRSVVIPKAGFVTAFATGTGSARSGEMIAKDTPEGHLLGVVDWLTLQSDRHSGNWIYRNGKPIPIDNDYAFGAGHYGWGDRDTVHRNRSLYIESSQGGLNGKNIWVTPEDAAVWLDRVNNDEWVQGLRDFGVKDDHIRVIQHRMGVIDQRAQLGKDNDGTFHYDLGDLGVSDSDLSPSVVERRRQLAEDRDRLIAEREAKEKLQADEREAHRENDRRRAEAERLEREQKLKEEIENLIPGGLFRPEEPEDDIPNQDSVKLREDLDKLSGNHAAVLGFLERENWQDGKWKPADKTARIRAGKVMLEDFSQAMAARRKELWKRIVTNDGFPERKNADADALWPPDGNPSVAFDGPDQWEANQKLNVLLNEDGVKLQNNRLRNIPGHKAAASWKSRMQKYIRQFTLNEDTTLFRGMTMDLDQVVALQPGAVVHDKGIPTFGQNQDMVQRALVKAQADNPGQIQVTFEVRVAAGEHVARYTAGQFAMLANTDLHVVSVRRNDLGDGVHVVAYANKLPAPQAVSVPVVPDEPTPQEVVQILDQVAHGARPDEIGSANILKVRQASLGDKGLLSRVEGSLMGAEMSDGSTPQDILDAQILAAPKDAPRPGLDRQMFEQPWLTPEGVAFGERAIDEFIKNHPGDDVEVLNAKWYGDTEHAWADNDPGRPSVIAGHLALPEARVIIENGAGRQWYVHDGGDGTLGFVPLAIADEKPERLTALGDPLPMLDEAGLEEAWNSGVFHESRFDDGGQADVALVQFGNGNFGVLKRTNPESPEMRKKNKLVYAFAKAAGIDIPDQIDIPGVGILTAFAPGEKHVAPENLPEAEKRKLELFDFITANADRHEANWLYDSNSGKIWPIDHDDTFWYNPAEPGRRLEPGSMLDPFDKTSIATGSEPGISREDAVAAQSAWQKLSGEFNAEDKDNWFAAGNARFDNLLARIDGKNAGGAGVRKPLVSQDERVQLRVPQRDDDLAQIPTGFDGKDNPDVFAIPSPDNPDDALDLYSNDGVLIGTLDISIGKDGDGNPLVSWSGTATGGGQTGSYPDWHQAAAALNDQESWFVNPTQLIETGERVEYDGRKWNVLGGAGDGYNLQSFDGDEEYIRVPRTWLEQHGEFVHDDASTDVKSGVDEPQSSDVPDARTPTVETGIAAVRPDVEAAFEDQFDADGESDLVPGEEVDLPYGFTLRRNDEGNGYEIYDADGKNVSAYSDSKYKNDPDGVHSSVMDKIADWVGAHPDAKPDERGKRPVGADDSDADIEDVDVSDDEDFAIGEYAIGDRISWGRVGKVGIIIDFLSDGATLKVLDTSTKQTRLVQISSLH